MARALRRGKGGHPAVRPEALPQFVETLEVLRTQPDFTVKEFPQLFSDAVFEEVERVVRELEATQLELHEIKNFGRYIVRDHPFITEVQGSIVDLASEAAGESVEPHYNFISLYTKLGVCPVHMDAPHAKWTLDLCVRQSTPWPIHLSQPVPWPEHHEYEGDNWRELIKGDLIFFHFVPKGMREAVEPLNWTRLFGIPELAQAT